MMELHACSWQAYVTECMLTASLCNYTQALSKLRELQAYKTACMLLEQHATFGQCWVTYLGNPWGILDNVG